MTDKEKAIVMAHTGICMLTGDKFQTFHKYVEDIMGRPIMTHEIGLHADTIKEKTKADFIALCADESSSENPNKWIPVSERLPEFNGRYLVSLPSRLIHEEYNVMILNFAKSLHGVPNKEAWYEVDSNMVLNEVPGVIAWMPLPEPYKESEDKDADSY